MKRDNLKKIFDLQEEIEKAKARLVEGFWDQLENTERTLALDEAICEQLKKFEKCEVGEAFAMLSACLAMLIARCHRNNENSSAACLDAQAIGDFIHEYMHAIFVLNEGRETTGDFPNVVPEGATRH
jgi:hypothetical protein